MCVEMFWTLKSGGASVLRLLFFFFSSRRRHTRFDCDWSSDVCSSDLIIDAELPDMSGIDACRLLHSDLRIGHTVPTLILTPNKPTPEQRVAALRTGVWDFLLYPPDREELLLSLETYLQAKRNIDVALAGLVDPATGLHTRPALARRARELGALMSRARGGLACVVFALDAEPADPTAGSISG